MLASGEGLRALLVSNLATLALASGFSTRSPATNQGSLETNGLSDAFDTALAEIQDVALLAALGTVDQNDVANLMHSYPSTDALSDKPVVSLAKQFKSKPQGVVTQDDSCTVPPYNSPVVMELFPPYDRAKATVFRYRQQTGVNIGSVFVNEDWMSTSLFKCANGTRQSELDIASGWGSTTNARALLERHWDTFITVDDFENLAKIGINTVRIPIGYWTLGPKYCQGTPFEPFADVYQNSWAHLVHFINLAAEQNIGVLIDLHGAVGSQNGKSHSGISDGNTNLFTNQGNWDKTIEVLKFLTEQLSDVTNIVGIEMLNEPQNAPQLEDFYTRALTTLRNVSPQAASMAFYLHDGFDQQRFHTYIKNRNDFVVQDTHSYFVFTPQDTAESAQQHTSDVRGGITTSLAAASKAQRNNLVIGEWSCALSPNSLKNEPDSDAAHKAFCEAQLQAYQDSTAGWSFWSFVKERCDGDKDWCFKNIVGKELPETFFSYPRAQGSTGPPSSAVISALKGLQVPSASQIPARTSDTALGALDTTLEKRTHRFARVHRRYLTSPLFSPVGVSTAQEATIKGFSDGFNTAKYFAADGLSKLGFTGQYVEDSLRSLKDLIEAGEEQSYRDGFGRGLVAGEAIVSDIAKSTA